jgi:aspartate/methionine/tyrosine aminotransferase
MKERTFVIGSLSKTYAMDGWRVGYLIGPKDLMNQALKMLPAIKSCPNTFVQEGARIAFNFFSRLCRKDGKRIRSSKKAYDVLFR